MSLIRKYVFVWRWFEKMSNQNEASCDPDLSQMTHWLFNNVTWCELDCVVPICPAVALCSNKIVDKRRERIVPQADFFLPSRRSPINPAFGETQ